MVDGITNGTEDSTGTAAREAWRRALRREMLARRETLPAAEHQRLSEAICQHLKALLGAPQGRTLGFCWPFRQEPDVRPLVATWIDQGGRAALPVVLAPHQPLIFRLWTPATPVAADRYGIPTPTEGAPVVPDVLLLPVNAFDGAGYRLGYGGGYFDRSLTIWQPRPRVIGLGFGFCQIPTLHPAPHDQQLDQVVTENGLIPLVGAATSPESPPPPAPTGPR